jgi:regulator of sirC expression with transglutaminase-like and TPR domain
MPKTKEPLKALLSLLTTEQGANLKIVKEKLVQIGPEVVGQLRQLSAAADAPNEGPEESALGERLRDVIEEIDGRRLEREWRQWLQGPDLEEGCFLLSRIAYPEIETETYQGLLDAMAEELRLLIKHERWPDGVIRVINQYLFTEKGFHGNTVHYYDPDNSYLNRVLDRRVGIPITLSTLYLVLARRLHLPIIGIGMPSHFLVKCEVAGRELFIDPFNEGQSLTKAECASFLINSGYGFKEHYLQRITDREILVRMMRNLLYIYGELKEQRKIRWLTRFVEMIQPDRLTGPDDAPHDPPRNPPRDSPRDPDDAAGPTEMTGFDGPADSGAEA